MRDARIASRDAAATPPIVRDPPPDAAPASTGYVQVVGGEELIRASVWIDGRNAGSVPNVFAVTLGRHEIVVEKSDGTRLPARAVEVTEDHNRAKPLRATW